MLAIISGYATLCAHKYYRSRTDFERKLPKFDF